MNKLALPKMLDFGRNQQWTAQLELNRYAGEMGFLAFNRSMEISLFVYFLKSKFDMDVAIETGTDTGITSRFLSLYFNDVYTIELNPERYNNATKMLSKYSNVKCYLGNSDTILSELLPNLKERRILLYLDGHCDSNVEAYWPLLNELKEISKTHRDNCILVIDDFKVPGRPDLTYDSINGNDCCYEYIQDQLDEVYSSYSYHYVIPSHLQSRAKFVAIPTAYQSV